jgi:hypothetical protein
VIRKIKRCQLAEHALLGGLVLAALHEVATVFLHITFLTYFPHLLNHLSGLRKAFRHLNGLGDFGCFLILLL